MRLPSVLPMDANGCQCLGFLGVTSTSHDKIAGVGLTCRGNGMMIFLGYAVPFYYLI